jgi:hypothetical protein
MLATMAYSTKRCSEPGCSDPSGDHAIDIESSTVTAIAGRSPELRARHGRIAGPTPAPPSQRIAALRHSADGKGSNAPS